MAMMTFDEWRSLISSPDAADRSHAANNLPDGEITPDVFLLLSRALEDEDALVRTCAVDSLGVINNEQARTALRTAFATETDSLTRSYIVDSLGFIGELRDLKLLVDNVLKEETDQRVSLTSAEAIAALALNYAEKTIADQCSVEDWKQRASAFARLKHFVELLKSKMDNAVEIAKARKGKEESTLEREHIENILALR
jgi:HEAT repeat protein